jgi:hypothetical protein
VALRPVTLSSISNASRVMLEVAVNC